MKFVNDFDTFQHMKFVKLGRVKESLACMSAINGSVL